MCTNSIQHRRNTELAGVTLCLWKVDYKQTKPPFIMSEDMDIQKWIDIGIICYFAFMFWRMSEKQNVCKTIFYGGLMGAYIFLTILGGSK